MSEFPNVLQELQNQYDKHFKQAAEYVDEELMTERQGAQAQIHATLAQAAATMMLVNLFGTGAMVNADVRLRAGGLSLISSQPWPEDPSAVR